MGSDMADSDGSGAGRKERRACERFAVAGTTSIVLTADGRVYHCAVENISLGGAKLRLPSDAPDTNQVTLEHPVAGKLVGQRAWRHSDHVGVRFEPPIRTLEHALRCVCLLLYADDEGESAIARRRIAG